MVILVSEDSNGYAHLFLIGREYFGFNTLESVDWINMKYLAYLNILFGDNHVQNSGNCKKGDPWGPPWYFKSDEKHSCRLISTKKCHTEE